MICHKNLIAPFTMFLINDGHSYEVGKDSVYFTKPNKKQVRIDRNGNMNDMGQSRYAIFLKIWLQRGKPFVTKLRVQFHLMIGNA